MTSTGILPSYSVRKLLNSIELVWLLCYSLFEFLVLGGMLLCGESVVRACYAPSLSTWRKVLAEAAKLGWESGRSTWGLPHIYHAFLLYWVFFSPMCSFPSLEMMISSPTMLLWPFPPRSCISHQMFWCKIRALKTDGDQVLVWSQSWAPHILSSLWQRTLMLERIKDQNLRWKPDRVCNLGLPQ